MCAGDDGGWVRRWEHEDFEAVFFFADAGTILKVVEQTQAGVELHGAVELGGPGAVALQVLTGLFVPHHEAHNAKRTTGRLGVYGGRGMERASGRRRCLVWQEMKFGYLYFWSGYAS